MVVTVTHSVVFQLGVVKINASFGALKYEHGTRVLLAQEFTATISNKIWDFCGSQYSYCDNI